MGFLIDTTADAKRDGASVTSSGKGRSLFHSDTLIRSRRENCLNEKRGDGGRLEMRGANLFLFNIQPKSFIYYYYFFLFLKRRHASLE